MQPNYAYVLEKCRELCPRGRILDYGCGGGDVVAAGRVRGMDLYGVEAFYSGSSARKTAVERGLFGTAVLELGSGGTIPFPDGHFDFALSNQVFEHVQDLDLVLREIRRVLRARARMLLLFPSREVIREGHCGVPMAHWFAPTSALRYPYMRLMRALGYGYFKAGKTQAAWAREFIDWLDRYTVYRDYAEIRQAFRDAGLEVRHLEEDYVAYRLGRLALPWLAAAARSTVLAQPARAFCRRMAGMVILATKE